MAITITPSPTTPRYLDPVTLTVAGATASTAYVLTATTPSGRLVRYDFTTDGSGGAVLKFVPQVAGGPTTFSMRLATEWSGTTTAAATALLTVGN